VFAREESGVRNQNTGVRIIVHLAREKVTILNPGFWILDTALARPTKSVLQAPKGVE
jgi:selenocysteine-specific translation elongation factor